MNIAYDVEFDLDSFLDLMNDRKSHRISPDADVGEAPGPGQPAEASLGAAPSTGDA